MTTDIEELLRSFEGSEKAGTPTEEIGASAEEFKEGQRNLEGGQEFSKGAEEIKEGLKNPEGGQAEDFADLKKRLLHHRCFAIPFNCTNWEPGTVVSVLSGKAHDGTKVPLVGIKLDDGRRLVKKWGSKALRILDELAELERRVRNYRHLKLNPDGTPIDGSVWSEEDIQAEIAAVADNVGRMASFPETGAYGVRIVGGRTIVGRIKRVIVNRQQRNLQYRIEAPVGDGVRVYTKTTSCPYLHISGEIDSEGEEIRARFTKRTMKKGRLIGSDAYENYKAAEVILQAAERNFKKASEELERARVNYERAKSFYTSESIM